jgi:peptidoglycan-associated lipoprotein
MREVIPMYAVRLLQSALLMLLFASSASCSRPRPVQQQAAPIESPRVAGEPAPDSAAQAGGDREGLDLRAPDPSGATGDPRWAVADARVYFDFDRSDLTAHARAVLAVKLRVLLESRDMHILITGHADERGSDEYNLALGLARAAAAKRYLTQRGVAGDRVAIVSMGEEQPACREPNESCWWQNRRDEFRITRIGAR